MTSYSLSWPSISLFSGPNCPQMRDLASKITKKFSGWHPRTPQREGATPSRTHPQHGYTPCVGAQAPPLLWPRSRKPFPQIKIYTQLFFPYRSIFPLNVRHSGLTRASPSRAIVLAQTVTVCTLLFLSVVLTLNFFRIMSDNIIRIGSFLTAPFKK